MSRSSTTRRISARLSAPAPMEVYFQSSLKKELNFEDEILSVYGHVDECYCRACFKIFTINDIRLELDTTFLSVLSEILFIEIDTTNGSHWICSQCNSTVNSFQSFKIDVMDKQTRFTEMVENNGHQDLRNIQALSTNPVNEFLTEIDIKCEPKEEVIEYVLDEPQATKKSLLKSKNTTSKIKKKVLKKVINNESKKKCETCKECGKKTFSLLNHRMRVHGYKHIFECSLCEYSSKVKRNLQYHFRLMHLGKKKKKTYEGSQVCPHCAKQVRKNLDEHIANIHFGERNFFCDLCSFSSYKKNALAQHIKNHHLPKTVNCSLCEYVTINKNRLKKHIMNVHETRNPAIEFICTIPDCNKRFKQNYNLRFHIRRCHEGEMNFPCDFPDCAMSFFTKKEKQTHYENSHCPKNMICDECGAAFSSLSLLRKHFTLHREYKNVCTYAGCDRKFRIPVDLRSHINRHHLGLKEHTCKDCPAEFYKRTDLERHIITKHMGIKYPCEVPGCGSNFTRREAYLYHLNNQHKGMSSDEKNICLKKLKLFCMEVNANMRENARKIN